MGVWSKGKFSEHPKGPLDIRGLGGRDKQQREKQTIRIERGSGVDPSPNN